MSESDVYHRLNDFTKMVYSACRLPVWCFGMVTEKRFYTTCPDAEEFELFLKLSGCLDYAFTKVEDRHMPVMLSDSLGMLYIADYVFEGENQEPSLLILLGPYFDSEGYLEDVIRALNRKDLSIETRLRMRRTFRQIPVITLDMSDQYAAMLHCAIVGGTDRLSGTPIYEERDGIRTAEFILAAGG